MRQGVFNTRAELQAANAPADQMRAALSRHTQNVTLFERGASYQDYLASGVDAEPISEDRYGFVLRNFRVDATADVGCVHHCTELC